MEETKIYESDELPGMRELLVETLTKNGCQPECVEDGTLKVMFQGEKFTLEPAGSFVRIWDPYWGCVKSDDPNLPVIREAVNRVNFCFGPTVIVSDPDEDGDVGIHSRYDILFIPGIPAPTLYLRSMFNSCFAIKAEFHRIFKELSHGERTYPAKNLEAAGKVLLGAICGDVIGSSYEFNSTKNFGFTLFNRHSSFTDDTVCSIAVADALVSGKPFAERLQHWCRKYPRAGYGGAFKKWIFLEPAEPYNSWGNGSAMRVSAVGAFARSLDEAMDLARASAEVTHNHPEGIKGAQATAAAITMALQGKTKSEIKAAIADKFGYDLDRRYRDIKPGYGFDVSCQGSVPESFISFLASDDYESAVRRAVAMGGDADTMGAIAGGIAAAYYGEIPAHILDECLNRLPEEMKAVITEFNNALAHR